MKGIRARVDVLDEHEIQLIHRDSLALLSGIGVKVPHGAVLDIAERAGARVDRDRSVLRIPRETMEALLAGIGASGRPERGARDQEFLEPLTGKISTQIHVVDHRTRTRRYGTLEDVGDGIALVERLERFPRSTAVVVPHDVPAGTSDVHTFRELFVYARKPGGTYILSPDSARSILDMAEVVGRKVEYLFETVSPLAFRRETLEIGLEFARRGHPLVMAPMVMAGATAPVTLAGMLTMQNAEVLASLFLIHALTGRYCDYVVGGHTIDMRSLICSFGSPNQALIGIGTAQMARFYGLRSESNSGLTDSLAPDFQAGMEKALSASFALLGGTKAIGCQGIVGADQGFCFEQLVLDDAWIGAYNHVLKGMTVDEETIGLSLMERTGIGGNYIAEEHTVEFLADSYWSSCILPREAWIDGADGDASRSLARAREFVREAVLAPRTPVLEGSLVDELDRIVMRTEGSTGRPPDRRTGKERRE